MDNHDSHISIEVTDLSKKNGVTLLTLPPHCSHKLQFLDQSVYGPFKTFYNQAANVFMVSHPGKTITIYDVAELVGKADEQALTPRNIRSGFVASGIWPFNRDVFGEDEFLSSYVSDRPQCSTNDCDTTTETKDDSNHSSASESKMHLSFCQYLLLLLLRRRSHHYLSAHSKGRNHPVQGKEEKLKF